VAKRLRRRSC